MAARVVMYVSGGLKATAKSTNLRIVTQEQPKSQNLVTTEAVVAASPERILAAAVDASKKLNPMAVLSPKPGAVQEPKGK